MTAADVLGALVNAGVPASDGAVQTASDDPDQRVGAVACLTRASFDLPGGNVRAPLHTIDRGGVIRVWPFSTPPQVFDPTVFLPPDQEAFGNGSVIVTVTRRASMQLRERIRAAVAGLQV
jgi:hypothetical protein